MRQKRAKAYRKQMLVYNHTFKFREPYQVLIDDQIVLDCHGSNFDLVKGLKRTLQAEVKVMITQCCMQSLYETNNQGAIELAKSFERRRCNHPPKDPKPPKECIESVVNVNGQNKHRYVVATQDIDIRRSLRRTPGVPLVYTTRSVMVMEPLSDASSKISKAVEEDKLFKGLNDPRNASAKTSEDATEKNPQEITKKRPRGPKQPNPLSVKKKKNQKLSSSDRTAETGSENATKTTKRRRKHRSPATGQQPATTAANDAT
ncbi:hypothetical protein HG537_0G04680 [Torulaspora globosa]|uniref:U three protein 23 n=1 Tax=Torulaspora globosa TaxID=48254 RepID=A0A7H9HXY7_9SACH|nr:hypothetical protein HG537_0G04680 [Torulaspora sp. CBS 2947]